MTRYRLRTLLILQAVGPMVLIALYVLSIGPAFALSDVSAEGTLRRTYQPVMEWAAALDMREPLADYVAWWCKPRDQE